MNRAECLRVKSADREAFFFPHFSKRSSDNVANGLILTIVRPRHFLRAHLQR